MSDPTRRAYTPQPGEPLLLHHPSPDTPEGPGLTGLAKQALSHERFLTDTGLPASAVVTTPLCATPLPHPDFDGAGPRRFTGVPAAMFWHPLLWLPGRLARRWTLRDAETGAERVEFNDEWSARLALELTASGLYDPTTGGWVDVLALYGLDLAGLSVQRRVEWWLDGRADEVLDAIDLTDLVTNQQMPDWSFQVVSDILPSAVAASWSLLASDLVAMTGDLLSPDIDATITAEVLAETIADAQTWLADALVAPEASLGDVLATISSAMGHLPTGDARALKEGPVTDVLRVLRTVAATYLPALEDLHAYFTDPAEQDETADREVVAAAPGALDEPW